ncbi:response regulator transcription factor [Nonomuraea sp. MCN248]|uniref:Response regulator transcription factor n=1 Tax=Nonomuraea corallina TaxID=2989783 RepID=A0ABT4S537_9ACTN|nr:response regulator transcription factor [Nonomuraea corallina]MDA0632135.1 response regulator transcription factor [Nonomuraea corallina]
MIRLVLADDEAMIRAGVRSILTTDPEIEVVAEAADGREAVDVVLANRPDIALLDIRMPRLDGLAAAEQLRATAPEIAVVMLTTFDEDEYVARALATGAAGFLLKAADPRELIMGVRAVADGAAYLSPRIAQKVIVQFSGGRMSRQETARKELAALTPRELDVLSLVGRGRSNQDIARELFVSEGTVKSHVSAILLRLRLNNRVQAAILAYEAGLIDS